MLFLSIDRDSSIPLYRQIENALREKILTGVLKPGDRLPTSRNLAADVGLSRNLVVTAYDQLRAEGYLEPRIGAGTFVARGTFLKDFAAEIQAINKPAVTEEEQDRIAFATSVPIRLFPRNRWAECLRDACYYSREPVWGYGESTGIVELKEQIRGLVARTKSIRCSLSQIIVVDGATQGLALCARALGTKGNTAVIEDPLLSSLTRVLQSQHMILKTLPVDETGMVLHGLADLKPEFVHVTPSHHFPLGYVMPIQKRILLIEQARQNQFYIVENDYDSEFRHSGPSISSLQLLDPKLVIHVGTFSGTMYPGLRLGYLIIPEFLLEVVTRTKEEAGFLSSSIKQAALALFIQRGYYDRHVDRVKKAYRSLRGVLIQALKETFGHEVEFLGEACGQYLPVRFTNRIVSEEVQKEMVEEKVWVMFGEQHTLIPGNCRDLIILGYGGLNEDRIREGVQRLYRAFGKK